MTPPHEVGAAWEITEDADARLRALEGQKEGVEQIFIPADDADEEQPG